MASEHQKTKDGNKVNEILRGSDRQKELLKLRQDLSSPIKANTWKILEPIVNVDATAEQLPILR